jgi:branched-subunit amino acid ABC-type transport system permease component
MHTFFLGVGFGLVTAAILSISAVALSLQFSVSPVPNFTHGDIMTVGAYAGYVVLLHSNNNLILGALSAGIAGVIMAAIVYRVFIEPLLKRRVRIHFLLVLLLGASIVVQNALQLIFGAEDVSSNVPTSANHKVGPLLLTTRQIGIIILAVVVLVFVHAVLRYTRFGRAIRAVADSPELASASGINAARITYATWVVSGFLTGLSGGVLALSIGAVDPTLGFGFLFVIFAAAIVGGIGQPYGAMLGALIVGLVMEVSAFYIPSDDKTVLAFGLLILALLFRPQGIIPQHRTALSI